MFRLRALSTPEQTSDLFATLCQLVRFILRCEECRRPRDDLEAWSYYVRYGRYWPPR